MALKYKYAFRQVPTNATPEQFEDFLNEQGQNGWDVIQIVVLGINRFVLAKKQLTI
jgi:hypothetical protein